MNTGNGIFAKMTVTLSGMVLTPFPRCVDEEPFIKAGFTFYPIGDTIEKWYIYAKAPAGWFYEEKNQFITEIFDDKRRSRGIIMILVDDTGVVYDASAWMTPRYTLGYTMEDQHIVITLTDMTSGETRKGYTTKDQIVTDIVEIANIEMKAYEDNLSDGYPGWKDPGCWDGNNPKLEADFAELPQIKKNN